MTNSDYFSFSDRLLGWFDQYGRKDLPWQHPRSPYRVWVSEIMLQQTQVVTVIPYFLRFMERFPDIYALAAAEQSEVLQYWSGLGYYARGRNLHKSAQRVVADNQGVLPDTAEHLMCLPGIGRSTAHAILSLAYQQPKAICDGNVRRVLARWLALDDLLDHPKGQEKLWAVAERLQSQSRPADYTQAMMDLGATLCTRTKPRCHDCPLQQDCKALSLAQASGVSVTQFPRKRIKLAKPEKQCAMYLLQHPDGRVWLNAPQQENGLWGGLYQLPQSLPEYFAGMCAVELAVTQHTFTHFKLIIQPYHLMLTLPQIDWLIGHQLGAWYHPEDNPLPRPAIVDKLICLIHHRLGHN